VTVTERAGRDARPLWQQVLDDLERRIAAGEFAERFPTDRELTDRYEVSRHTVREAVRHLRARGLVDRHRGRGSFLSGQVQQPLGSLYSLFEAVEQQGLEQRSEVLRFDEVRLDRLRFAGDDPLALDRVWLPAAIGRTLRGVDLSRTSLYEQLDERADVRVTGVDETIEPVLPDADARELLRLEADEALLRVQRLGWSGDRPVECRTTLVRGRRFVYTSSWREGGAAAKGGRFKAAP
jgi:GntR family transcriptional regulator